MKKLLIIAGAVIATLVVLALVIPFFIPMEKYKTEITAQAYKATGRNLVIAGPLKLSLFPSISVEAEDVTFSNAQGAANEQMATLDRLHISLKLLPLITGSIAVDGFELIRPVIHLETDRNGKGNWELQSGDATSESTAESEGGGLPSDLTLGNVRLVDGLITYKDGQTGDAMEFSALNVSVDLPAMDGPLKAEGDLVWNGEKVEVEFETRNLATLMDGKPEQIELEIDSTPVAFSLNGTASTQPATKLDGKIKLNVPSIRALAAWAGTPLDMPGEGLGPLNIEGKLDISDNRYAFSDATLKLDNINATGALSITTGGARPKVTGKLVTDNLDLNPYLPPEAAETEELVWSEEPIDLSGLKAADLDFTFKTDSLKYRKISIGKSALGMKLDNGLLTVDLQEMALYKGTGKGKVTINGRGDAGQINASFDLANVEAEPLFMDAGDFDRLSGTLSTQFDVETTGKSQKDLVSALNGNGDMEFRDGMIKGVDVAAVAENIEKIANGVKSGGAGILESFTSGDILGSLQGVASIFGGKGDVDKSTKFTSLIATWTAEQGVINNNDLELLGPLVNNRALFKMTGAGDVSLPAQMIDYKAQIKSFAKAEAGGGIGGTVRLSGPLSEPGACVELGSLCIGDKTKPADMLKMKLKDKLTNDSEDSDGKKDNPLGALKGLMKKPKSE